MTTANTKGGDKVSSPLLEKQILNIGGNL